MFSKAGITADLSDTVLGPAKPIRELQKTRFTQYVILMWMAEFFQQRQGGHEHVHVYVQDPDLKEADEQAMESIGITILDGEYDYQEGFTKIDNHTLVYDAIISSRIFQIYMEYAYPAAVMTQHLDTLGPYESMQDHHKYVYLQD